MGCFTPRIYMLSDLWTLATFLGASGGGGGIWVTKLQVSHHVKYLPAIVIETCWLAMNKRMSSTILHPKQIIRTLHLRKLMIEKYINTLFLTLPNFCTLFSFFFFYEMKGETGPTGHPIFVWSFFFCSDKHRTCMFKNAFFMVSFFFLETTLAKIQLTKLC